MPDLRQGPPLRLRRLARILLVSAIVVAAFFSLGRSYSPEGAHAQSVDAPASPNIVLTELLDYHLPGTQPNGLAADPLLPNCNTCHVDHIKETYKGSMMANSARDPLFRAALQVANEDARYAGEFCIRCHVPNAWLNGRSAVDVNGTIVTNGSKFVAEDLEGITCLTCHRMIPNSALVGESLRDLPERDFIKNSQSTLLIIGSAANVLDRQDFRRGPYNLNVGAHDTTQTSFMRDALMCAGCHEIDNPLLSFDATSQEFFLNTNGQASTPGEKLFPVERTYSEWQFSQFNTPAGVTGISNIYPGLKRLDGTATGPITVCQDCHMPMVESPLVNGGTPRTIGVHSWPGGNTLWQQAIADFWGPVLGDTYFTDAHATQTLDARTEANSGMLRAAELDMSLQDKELTITLTNNTGHKLPTGYAEGRRMWLQLSLFQSGVVISRPGEVDIDGNLIDPVRVWEIKQGLTEDHAIAVGRPELEGEGFHFALNNKVFKDNRIPPRGWTNAQYATKSMEPVGAVYADGQYTDTLTMVLPEGVDEVDATLMYQTASGEYLDFLEVEANDPVADDVVGVPVNWGSVVGKYRDAPYNLDRGESMAFAGIQVPNLGLSKEISPLGNLLPGQPVSYTLYYSASSVPAMVNVALTDSVPSVITNVSVQSVPNGTTTIQQNSNAPQLTWSVTSELASYEQEPGNNILYISGFVDGKLNQDSVVTNTVSISGNGKFYPDNTIRRSAAVTTSVIPPRVRFATTDYTVAEASNSVAVAVTLNVANPYTKTVVKVSTADGSAHAGTDYTAITNKELIFAPGQKNGFVTVVLLNDTAPENDEAFNVLLASPEGAVISAQNVAIVTVTSEDPGTPVGNESLFLPSVEQ